MEQCNGDCQQPEHSRRCRGEGRRARTRTARRAPSHLPGLDLLVGVAHGVALVLFTGHKCFCITCAVLRRPRSPRHRLECILAFDKVTFDVVKRGC